MTADDTAGWHRPRRAALVAVGVGGVLAVAATGLPHESAPLPTIARHAVAIGLPRWGTTEIVSEIVYGSRGWDTFGETFILLAAVVAVVVLSRGREQRREFVGEASAGRTEQAEADPSESPDPEEDSARAAEEEEQDSAPPPENADDEELGRPGPERAQAMTAPIRVGVRIAAPILAVAAVYLAAWGYTPGGGFPAGAAITGVALLVYTAFGHGAVEKIRPDVLDPAELLGAAAIVAIAVIGLLVKGSVLANWVPLAPQQTIRAGGTLQLFSGAELVEVATGLTIAIFALLGMQHDWAPDESDDDAEEPA